MTPILYLKRPGYCFYGNKKSKEVLRKPKLKEIVEQSVNKLLVNLHLMDFSYWDRHEGVGAIENKVTEWLGFDEMIPFDNGKDGLQAIICISHDLKLVSLNFRGTDNTDKLKDWKKNISIAHYHFKSIFEKFKHNFPGAVMPAETGEGHWGFTYNVSNSFQSLWEIIKLYILRDYELDVNGHSKGGGEEKEFSYIYAYLFGKKIRETNTAGQPRALDKDASRQYEQAIDHTYRFCNPGDLVPYFPTGFRYEHTEHRMVLDAQGINEDQYDFAEFSSNLGRRFMSMLEFKFAWGTSQHYLTAYIKRVWKIYRKFNIDIYKT